MGGYYVNDFIDRGRVKKVYVQADAQFRMLPGDINNLYVRSANGEMVPFSTFSSARWIYGSPRLERYNGMPSMELLGEAAPGRSTGEAMSLMENLASQLPNGIGYDWTGMSYQERLSVTRRRRCTQSHSLSFSSALPLCMKAGQFRSR